MGLEFDGFCGEEGRGGRGRGRERGLTEKREGWSWNRMDYVDEGREAGAGGGGGAEGGGERED